MIAIFLRAGSATLLVAAAAMVILTAMADWYVGNRASLGVLYILPMMLGAVVLPPWATAALAFVCASLRAWFDLPSPPVEHILRFVFAFITYSGSGLFVTALIRNRGVMMEHLRKLHREQELRVEAEEQLRVLAESSPAAILTVDGMGAVLAANHAANGLFSIPEGQTLRGRSIGDYLPVLADALQLDGGPDGFRTAAQCRGRKDNGDIFQAHTWFSSYRSSQGIRLAAIAVDSSEEMRDREEEILRQLIKGNRIAATAVAHELRNLCGAISIFCSNLKDKHALAQDDDFQGLWTLVKGLQKIASVELRSSTPETLEAVSLREVLNDLRIVIEPEWREIDGAIRWKLPTCLPMVLADRHGLFQAFLNLVQNSRRAVQEGSVRELSITVSVAAQRADVRFHDTGPGISAPDHLFEPFQAGADGTGLGLYVSRVVVRSYGGELRFEPQNTGSCFAVELQVVDGANA